MKPGVQFKPLVVEFDFEFKVCTLEQLYTHVCTAQYSILVSSQFI